MHVPETSMPSRPVEATSVRRESQERPLLADTRSLNWIRVRRAGYSIADQALAVGGMFLANVALARTQSREEYGVFALCYSIYLFVAGLYSAAVGDAYTVHGAGRYRDASAGYFRLMATANVLAGAASAALLLGACGVLRAFA